VGLEEEPLGVFTRLARTTLFLEALQAECLEPHGLSFNEYAVLRVLSASTPAHSVSPSRLAEAVLTSSGGMTRIIDRLDRAGLVERSTDPDDRRGIIVTLTAAGHTRSESASASYAEGRSRVLARLAPIERAAIDDGLRRLLEAFEDDRADHRRRPDPRRPSTVGDDS
jgi:DNA-binding MarR family transcriptional regulator